MTDEEAIKYLRQIYPNGAGTWLDEQRIEAISMAIESLQKDTSSENLAKAADDYVNRQHLGLYNIHELRIAFETGARWQKQQIKKEAVDAEAEWYWYDGWHITFNDDDIHAAMPAGVVDGDKVKLIVIFYKGGLNDE